MHVLHTLHNNNKLAQCFTKTIFNVSLVCWSAPFGQINHKICFKHHTILHCVKIVPTFVLLIFELPKPLETGSVHFSTSKPLQNPKIKMTFNCSAWAKAEHKNWSQPPPTTRPLLGKVGGWDLVC